MIEAPLLLVLGRLFALLVVTALTMVGGTVVAPEAR